MSCDVKRVKPHKGDREVDNISFTTLPVTYLELGVSNFPACEQLS